MLNLALNAILGACGGLCREYLVIKYYLAVQGRKRLVGSLISFMMGILDLFVLAALAMDGNLAVAVGYVIGEAFGTYLGIGGSDE